MMGSLRVGHDWETSLSLFTFMHWRRKWPPTPVFLPGESRGQGSLVGCCLWGHTELETTEVTQQQQQQHPIVYTYYILFIHSSVDGHLGCFLVSRRAMYLTCTASMLQTRGISQKMACDMSPFSRFWFSTYQAEKGLRTKKGSLGEKAWRLREIIGRRTNSELLPWYWEKAFLFLVWIWEFQPDSCLFLSPIPFHLAG